MTETLPLPERIGLSTAADLHSALLSRMGEPLVLDASEVRSLSTPALQVLLSAAKTWRSSAVPLTVSQPSPHVLELLETAGLSLDDLASKPTETRP